MLQKVTTTDDGLHVYRSRRRWLLTGIGVVIVAASVAAASWLRPETPRSRGFVAEFGGPGHPLISMHEEDPAENEGYLNARSAWIVLGPVFVYVAVVLFLRRAKRNPFHKG
jgi:hypothetical protein